MAGTNRKEPRIAAGGPAIVLVEPQLGENVGSAARAMLNCGLTELRLVNPRFPWPSEQAVAMASGATEVLDRARLYGSFREAMADLTFVVATTARPRGMVKEVLTPEGAAAALRAHAAAGGRAGIVFGGERAGLTNDDVTLCDAILQVPLNPAFASLNLGQAVLLCGYAWLRAGDDLPARAIPNEPEAARKASLNSFFQRLEQALRDTGFLYPPHLSPQIVRNIRNMFQRARLTEQEVRTLHGMLTSLLNPRPRGRREDPPSSAA